MMFLLVTMILGVCETWGQTDYAIYVSEKGYLKNVANEHETDFGNFATNSKWTYTTDGKLKCGTIYLKDNGSTITTTTAESEATVWTKETSGVKSYFKTSDGKYMKSGWLLSEGVSEEDDRYVGYEVKGDGRVIWIPAGTYVLINKNIDYSRTDKNPPNLLYDPKKANKRLLLKPAPKVAAENTRWEVTLDGDGYYFLKNVGTGNNIRHSSTATKSNPTAESVADPSSNNTYRFILKVYGNNREYDFPYTISKYDPWCFDICPYNVQTQSFNVPGDNINSEIALRDFYFEGHLSFGSQWHFIPYETENVNELQISGKTILSSTGEYTYTATGSYYTKVIGSENPNNHDVPITVNGVINSNITYNWSLPDSPSFVQLSEPTTTGNTSSVALTVNSLPSSSTTFRLKCTATDAANGYSWEEETTVDFLIVEEIESLEEITNPDGIYKLKNNITSSSGVSGVSRDFKGILDGDFHTITGLSEPLFGSLNNAVVKNVLFDEVSINNEESEKDAGAICEDADGGTLIYNCGVLSGSVGGTRNVGGLVGLIKSGSSVRVVNCFNYANVKGGSYAAGIVGKNEGTIGSTRIALCMMYGNVTGAANISPVYGASEIVSNAGTFTEYNYWLYSATGADGKKVLKDLDYTAYNAQLAIENDEYLTRFPFYRHILNTHRELASYFLFGDYTTEHVSEVGHWVLKKGANSPKYPILEKWRTNTKRTTEDIAANLPNTNEERKGKRLTTMGSSGYLTVHVGINGTNCGSVDLPITDMNEDEYDYTWGKVVLPFVNEFSGWAAPTTNTSDYGMICTGWEITNVGGQSNFSISQDEPYNFADRNNKNKDIYANDATDNPKNPYIFAQGGNYIVPYGVSSIYINAHFAKAFYLSDPTYDIGYNSSYTTATPLGGYVYGSNQPTYHGKTVYTNLNTLEGKLAETSYPHDQAIVLVGNYHYVVSTGGSGNYLGNNTQKRAVTIMSVDEDNNQEPDYGWYSCNLYGRVEVAPLRFDFVPIIEMGMSSRVGTSYYPGVGIWHTRGWFELTETCVSNMSQCEINSDNFAAGDDGYGNNRWIVNSGRFVQIVRARDGDCKNLSYIQIGGNAYVKELYPGSHSDKALTCTSVPIVVTGGQVDECFMTGYSKFVNGNVIGGKLKGDMIYFWCAGGKIKKFLGAYVEEPIKNNSDIGLTAKIDHALIGRFFGGGTSASARIKGDIDITIDNSQVDFYCGGPEFGDMYDGKKVTTHATGTTFGEYYGAGFGGTSLTYQRKAQTSQLDITSNETTEYDLDFENYTNNRLVYESGNGIGNCYKFEYIFNSNGSQGVSRFHTGYAQFSLAKTGSITNELNNCIIKVLPGENSPTPKQTLGDFYGAGCQGLVNGTVTSILTGCTLEGNAFGGGYKAASNEVIVYPTTKPDYSVYTRETGIFSDFEVIIPNPVNDTYTWEQGNATTQNTVSGKTLYTSKDVKMNELGNVTGAITLTIDGGYVGGTSEGQSPEGGNVYGGGNESKSLNNTTVTLKGDAVIYGDVFGGGNKAEVQGTATVKIEE